MSSPAQFPGSTTTSGACSSFCKSSTMLCIYPPLQHLQYADCFGEYDLAADPDSCQKCDLVLNSKQFLERLEGEANPINDLIALPDVAKDDRKLTGGECGECTCLVRHVGHFHNRATEQRLAELIADHGPQWACRGVSKQPAYTNRGVGHQPGSSRP